MASMTEDTLILVDETRGITVIPQASELRRLNWFDGKLLRADDLRVEQDHLRGLVRRANQTGGAGVVHGFSCRRPADARLGVGPGLAVDPGGRTLVLPVDVVLDIGELIDRTAGVLGSANETLVAGDAFGDCVDPQPVGQTPLGGARWYVITVGWAEALCGSEDVY